MKAQNASPFFPPKLDQTLSFSLSLQFLVKEWIKSLELLRSISKDDELAQILSKMDQFFTLNTSQASKSSILEKLCFYCDILIQSSLISDSLPQIKLEEIRHLTTLAKYKLTTFKKTHSYQPYEKILDLLHQLRTDLVAKLEEFFHLLNPFFKSAKTDENILSQLIEKKDQINSFLKDTKVENLLFEAFPNGQEELKNVIYEGYSKRGFEEFFLKIEPLIDSIAWDCICFKQAH